MTEKYAERTEGCLDVKIGDLIDIKVAISWKVGKVKVMR